MCSGYKKRFLSYLNKEGFDHTQGVIDPTTFHTSVVTLARLFSVMDDEVKPWWIYISPIGVAVNAFVALVIISYSVAIYLPEMKTKIDLVTENATYWLVIGYKAVIVTMCFQNREDFYHLFQALRKDFEYIGTRGLKYSDAFFENQKFTFKACVLSGLFIGFIGGGMICTSFLALAYVLIFYEEGHVRPTPYPFTFYKWDTTRTPYYEIMYGLCVSFTISHTYIYIFMTQSQVLWVRQIACKADLIVWNIRDLLNDVQPAKNQREVEYYNLLLKHRLQEIVMMHHSMLQSLTHYSNTFRKCLLCEQKLSSPIICMTAYCSAEKIEAGGFPLILVLLCTAVVVVVFIPSYLSTFLSEKMQSVGEEWGNIPFWNAGKVIRPYAIVMMQRSTRQLPIQAAGFEDIGLQTYANLLSRSYQWFNMLRQANFS